LGEMGRVSPEGGDGSAGPERGLRTGRTKETGHKGIKRRAAQKRYRRG
jgi:hypothetical protein